MPRFIAVHTAPFKEEQLAEMMEQMAKVPAGISFKQSYCDFKDGKFFCEWQANSKESIEKLFKTMNVPFDSVYPVRLFNAAKKGFVD
jgi:hypothetical protein